MTYGRFFALLGAVTAATVLLLYPLHYLLAIDFAIPFTITCLLAFVLLTVLIFALGKRTAGSDNKMLFGNVFLGTTLLKMMLVGTLVFGYVVLAEPTSKLFILPFFLLYIVYTGFEVYFLMLLARETK